VVKRSKITDELLGLISSLIKIPPKKAKKKIIRVLKELCRLYGAQYCFLGEISKKTLRVSKLIEYSVPGMKINSFRKVFEGKDLTAFSYMADKIKKREVFYIKDISRMPEKALAEKEILKDMSIGSMICVPIEIPWRYSYCLIIANIDKEILLYRFEISLLELVSKTMVNALRKAQIYAQLKKTSRMYGLLAKNAHDIIFKYSIWPEKKFDYINPAVFPITGYRPKEFYANPTLYHEIICSKDSKILDKVYSGSMDFSKPLELRLTHKSGHIIWVEVLMRPNYDSRKKLIAIEAIARDITKRKKDEKKIEYLSFHDKLTGLYNRAYFDEELARLDTTRSFPLSLIVADLNGLKLVNDVFGHLTGDELLRKCAECLIKCCRQDDILARWGGDEFTIILPKTSYKKAREIVKRIYGYCEVEKQRLNIIIPLSLSLGVATKTSESTGLESLIKKAEDDMYKRKINDKKENIESVISSMKKSLITKEIETEGHIERLKDHAVNLSKRLGFREEMIDEIRLLAEMHDIGKVAVFEEILKKDSSLTKSEWDIIKKHSEIGYRLVSSSSELVSIAEYVLGHHERWDGKGYPQGLKGEDIPIYSRILAISDAYDVMTHGSSYRRAVTKKDAIAELLKEAGKQFDPNLIKEFIQTLN